MNADAAYHVMNCCRNHMKNVRKIGFLQQERPSRGCPGLSVCRSAMLILILTSVPILAAEPERTIDGNVSLAGRVMDPSGAFIPNATVSARCGRIGTEVRTNDSGGYLMRVAPGTCSVTVRKAGFSTESAVMLIREEGAGHDVTLNIAALTEQVTVTAGGFEQLVMNAPASVSILGREELATGRLANLAEALQTIEGIDTGLDVGKTGGMTISLRGMPADYTLVLIDGRRQNSAGNVTPNGFGETATGFIPPPGAIERIEVVRGPMSTLYGSDAMGGVVNIITRSISSRWSGDVTIDGTMQGNRDYGDTGQGNMYASGPLLSNRVGLSLRGGLTRRQAAGLRYRDVDGERIDVTGFGLSPTRSDTRRLGGRLTVIPHEKHEIHVDIDNSRQVYDNRANQLGATGIQGGYAEELEFGRRQAVFAHSIQLSSGLIDYSVMHNATETSGRTIPIGTPGKIAGAPRTLDASNTIVDGKYITPVGRHILSIGGQWWNAEMTDAVAPNPYSHRQAALFAENEWQMDTRLALTLGLRYDNHSVFGGNTSPRAYLVYEPVRRLTLKGGISRGFKTPRLDQIAEGITGFGRQGTLPLIGSPGLKPEKSTNTEMSANWSGAWLNAGITFFNNEFREKIAAGPGLENCGFSLSPDRPGCVDYGHWPDVDLFGQSINVDRAYTRGIESSVRLALGKRWSLQNNYTFTRSRQLSGEQEGQPLVNTPTHMYNARLNFMPTSRLTTWLRLETRSSRIRGSNATAVAATEQLGRYRAYALAHLGAGYRVTPSVTLNMTVYNLFDKDFLGYAPYLYNNQLNYTRLYNNLQEPRRLWVSLGYSF
jgi:outer membrane receptor for ferrienterochelin and colicins